MRLRRITRSPAGYWIAVAVLAAATGLIVARLVVGAQAARQRFGGARPVAVATRTVAVGRVLSDRDVAVHEVPAAFGPADAAASHRAVVGRTVVVRLFAGEAVLDAHLAPAGLTGPTAHLRPGRRAVAIPVGAAVPAVGIGDEVDVLATQDTAGTVTVARAATVIDARPDAVTVALSTGEANAVADAVARGAVTLAVRSPVERP
jgi:Flp pilus assembly protein CpaB